MNWENNPSELNEKEVHIWITHLASVQHSAEQYHQILSTDEQERASRFRFEKDKNQYIIARAILRKLIGFYLSRNPRTIQFAYNHYSKPLLKEENNLHFNISHSAEYAVFAFTHLSEIGIDVEWTKRPIEVDEIAPRFFSGNETNRLFALPKELQTLGFYNCWTRKEAIIKAIGHGLSFPLDAFEVSLAPNLEAELLATYWDPYEAQFWQMESFEPEQDYIGALAIRANNYAIKYYKWKQFQDLTL